MQEVLDLLQSSSYTVVFTGAGMSTESGLPDFRTKDRGLWEKFNPDELANVHALINNFEEFTNFYQYRLREINKFQPHKGHLILAKWEKVGLINSIITQNVDGFHHDAGNENVMELHGTFRKFYCNQCKREQSREDYLNGKSECSYCDGPVRPGIVLFGEMLPEDVFYKAELETAKAELFIVLGSSLTVSPANMFPMVAKEQGAKLVIVNREPTPMDHYADVIIRNMSIKEFLVEMDKGTE
ncbi:SIR2 family NAD-dependent protein deacylase [Ornithinibacillus halotolerans]|uniref:protein acetyllysine N-acetyltransferase n=1 Tax=Ornithinibacillus halotolerans TaxID=1274357 RepID=A0A916S4D2_9BACI|nr:NAD-dependent deacylase [Ornithinibacillus halotolerans]GGA82877.1 NAD-dependent deacetylase [Ornithinibacillus halotolerans]